jgi:hypothetical protein
MPAIAAAIVMEGCIGETLAAFCAHVQLQVAAHPAARTALAEVAVDEARHAGLAWRALRWIVQEGGPSVRQAALEALSEALRLEPKVAPQGSPHALLEARGIVTGAAFARLRRVALERAVRPMAVAVLGEGAKELGWLGDLPKGSVDSKKMVFEEARRLIAREARLEGLESVSIGKCTENVVK